MDGAAEARHGLCCAEGSSKGGGDVVKKRTSAAIVPAMAKAERESQLEALVAEYLAAGSSRAAIQNLKELAASLHVSPRIWEELRGRVVLQLRQCHAGAPGAAEAIEATAALLGALDRGYREGYRAVYAESRRSVVDVFFGPRDDCRTPIVKLLEGAKSSVDTCVFTITNDELAGAMLRAARRGVATRVITEGDKVGDHGCDILGLRDAGIETRWDTEPERLMHHKFVIVDHRVVATGSLNWTYSATRKNYENLIVSTDPDVVNGFREEYERIWGRLLPQPSPDGGNP
jgi:hypothetical protein